ncbi:OmpA/MotB family protein [Lignipirellula cremea]|uniref:Motility protein B n=1 Tax=Lignipirellula cremea TaxID=2528010 RepID=A0A518E0H6_9BACT|nr:flagellar motor protein MotB [Lignipirellula cremea]QDU97594.1 Motility protein B [Lignipirellula cremea]
MDDGDDVMGIPEWVVTFGDMMSLLLTFFIMLVSLSEIKQEDKYQAMLASLHAQFGYASSMDSVLPGDAKPRNSPVEKIKSMGRANRKDTMNGGDKVKAPVGDNPRVQMVRQGDETGIGAVVFFSLGSTVLTQPGEQSLTLLTPEIAGKPQHVEIRGHVSRRPLPPDAAPVSPWDLAYERAKTVMRYLVDEEQIDRERIRISVAGPNEPLKIVSGSSEDLTNDRVEVYLLDSLVSETQGDPDQRDSRFVD